MYHSLMKNFVYILIVLLILGLVGYVVLSPEENSEKYDPVTNKEKSKRIKKKTNMTRKVIMNMLV